MPKMKQKKVAKKKTENTILIPYRATPYQFRALARIRYDGMSRQYYIHNLIERDLSIRAEAGWTPEYGGEFNYAKMELKRHKMFR